ncbi:putative pectinesterase inhibitor-like [Capsicum annuum]|nr:putative pectinesterase inhibitor-like [Capsicum annuum]
MKRGTVLISSGRSVQEQEDSEQLQQHDISNTEPRDEDGDVDASLLSATKLQDSAGKGKVSVETPLDGTTPGRGAEAPSPSPSMENDGTTLFVPLLMAVIASMATFFF